MWVITPLSLSIAASHKSLNDELMRPIFPLFVLVLVVVVSILFVVIIISTFRIEFNI